MQENKLNIETKCVQSGYTPENTQPRITPIVQSTTYLYDNCDMLADAFDLKTFDPIYSRISNPTLCVLEEKIAHLENAKAALSTSSGQAANFYSVLNIAKSGDNIIALSNLYGGTFVLFKSFLKKIGINVKFISCDASYEQICSLIDDKTKLIFAETISNPSLDVLDFEKISNIAKQKNIVFVVDNTFATPYLCNPIDYGANVITHSSTKYLDGHATSVGGLIVDCANFDWESSKYPDLNTPDENYHGLIYTKQFKDIAYIAKARVNLLRDIGATMSPFNAFLTNLGIETLHLRMQKHSDNALLVAKYLENHKKIKSVNYPLIESSKSYKNAKKYLKNGASGVVSFEIKSNFENAKKFIDNMKLATLVTHVGDLRTHAIHPASTTHRQLSHDEQIKAGISQSLIRYSVGIENIDDILNDIELGLSKIDI